MFVSLVQSIVGRKDAEIAAVMSTMHHCARPLYCNVMSNWRWRDAEIPSPKTNPPSITNRLISGTNLKLHWTVVPFQTDLSLHLPISRLYSIISSSISAVPFRSWHPPFRLRLQSASVTSYVHSKVWNSCILIPTQPSPSKDAPCSENPKFKV